ncbi:sensor histidine kinase, partial [Actinomadura kijaniata]|uniref:sensor histidine kinase n=1 Tax=Actinomadura kijaniata TaxID=46161 RepID=UPI00082EA4B5
VALRGARALGTLRLGAAARLLGERIEPDARGGARAFLHLLVQPLVTALGLAAVYVTWLCGAVLLTYPVQLRFGLNEITSRDASGAPRHGLHVGGLYFDTPASSLVVAGFGLVLLAAAPWVVRAAVRADLAAARALLGVRAEAGRIRDLEESRSFAVEDTAATLRRIERDLHDGAQVRLVALTMHLAMLRETLPADAPEAVRDMVDAAHGDARAAIAELRELVRGIHPPTLDKGLDVALATLAARSPVPAEIRTELPVRPAAAIESIAYFCVAELLANAGKHAAATRVLIEAEQPGGTGLRVRVTDDGRGGARVRAGGGLAGLSDRARTVDGTVHVDSPPGGPTVVTVVLPLLP